MGAKNLSEHCQSCLNINASVADVAGSNSFLPFLKASKARTVGALPVIGSALALLLGSSSPSDADNISGILGGIVGGMISQQMQMQRPAAPVYATPPPVYVTPPPVYVTPAPVYVAPSQPYHEPEYRQRATRPIVTKVVPAVAVVAKLSKADKNAIEDLKNTLQQFGSDQDIIVMVSAHDTPRVVRDLSGTPQFFRPAQGCFPFKFMNPDLSTPQGRFLSEVLEEVQKKGSGKVIMSPCTAKNFGQYDLLVFSPDQMDPAENPAIRAEYIQPIVDAVKQGSFIQYGKYAKAEFEADAQARADVIVKDEERRLRGKAEAKREFDARDGADISAIYLKSPATNICVGGGPINPLPALLANRRVPVFADLLATSTKVLPPADANPIFMSVKQHDCDAVIGTTAMLRDVIPALLRDNVIFDYHAGSVTPVQVKEFASMNFGEPTVPARQ